MILESNWKQILEKIEENWYVVTEKREVLKCVQLDPLTKIYTFIYMGDRQSGITKKDLSDYVEYKNQSIKLAVDFTNACRLATGNKIKAESMFDPALDENAIQYTDDWKFIRHGRSSLFIYSESRTFSSLILQKRGHSYVSLDLEPKVIKELQSSWIDIESKALPESGTHLELEFLTSLMFDTGKFYSKIKNK